jgi:hypothetical protein
MPGDYTSDSPVPFSGFDQLDARLAWFCREVSPLNVLKSTYQVTKRANCRAARPI